ncbi:MAG: CotH kinase family protein [Ignavibacteria bacterium]|nr:CotH kinase family protein [Ignavibacteria bacterium]
MQPANVRRARVFLFTVVVCILVVQDGATAQGFYDPNVIQDIRIEFTSDDWNRRLDTAKAGSGTYLIAKHVTINGEDFKKVGVKYKGKSSYKPSNAKNSLHLELNHLRDGQDYQGFTDILLNNAFADPSFIRDALGYSILREYMDAPRCNHARVWINGRFHGLYANVESVNKRFLRSRFGNADGVFFKCVPEHPGPKNMCTLTWLGADSAAYEGIYELKSRNGWKELLALITALGSKSAQLDRVLDADRALWMHAFNAVLLNLDSYSGNTAHNYYLYEDAAGRFLPIVWDLNMSFGTCAETEPGAQLALPALKMLTPLLHAENPARPLISRLLADPVRRRMYLAHVRTLLREQLLSGSYKARARALMQRIEPAVKEDTRKLYGDEQFRKSLTSDLVDGRRTIPGIVPLMEARAAYLQNFPELKKTQPAIGDRRATRSGGSFSITVSVRGAVSVLLASRGATGEVFRKTPMFDDGAHGDGRARDGVYGARIANAKPGTQYYIYAENKDAGAFSPERAEHAWHEAGR